MFDNTMTAPYIPSYTAYFSARGFDRPWSNNHRAVQDDPHFNLLEPSLKT